MSNDIISQTISQNRRIKWIISGLSWDEITEWEKMFVESIEGQSDSGKALSEKQMDILERIYKEKGR
jgi:hypothetical protein